MLIPNMECPKCQYPLEATFNTCQDKDANYVEVELSCTNGHKFFVRIKVEDLIEVE